MAMAAAAREDPRIVARIEPSEGDKLVTAEIAADILEQLVPPRFADAAFDAYKPLTKGQLVAVKACRAWVDRAKSGEGAMLALIGPTGNGKSHLLYAAANALLGPAPRRYPVPFYSRSWFRLANELRYGGESPFAPGRPFEAHELRALLWRQRVVLIDEVRPTAGTSFDDTELAMFACHAYDAKVSVLITSNVSPLAEVMGAPAASRFAQVVLDGPDWRQR
jgi:chromosomal replication initiation ATPase DnaA